MKVLRCARRADRLRSGSSGHSAIDVYEEKSYANEESGAISEYTSGSRELRSNEAIRTFNQSKKYCAAPVEPTAYINLRFSF